MPSQVKAVHIEPSFKLRTPLVKEWHARRNQAWIIHDSVTNTVLLAQKLPLLAAYINKEYARNRFERVTTRGLYEAADRSQSEGKQPHKLRYIVSGCALDHAHVAFESIRAKGVSHATLLTQVR